MNGRQAVANCECLYVESCRGNPILMCISDFNFNYTITHYVPEWKSVKHFSCINRWVRVCVMVVLGIDGLFAAGVIMICFPPPQICHSFFKIPYYHTGACQMVSLRNTNACMCFRFVCKLLPINHNLHLETEYSLHCEILL